ncbi:hypothetical protein BKK79_00915 [Cupriavidus sp. USMAA2-4]|uniref:DUF2829 domain-containing protein n=1 Tax=Cupriavidus sp. USMAA2-4 TaxID=876364 RepID=UPI0008A670DA|nr:DUF2829 domain-containing protein [Cupriavidus sp. USMAA2-4]AOY90546.1 hypothetical protein BKK79_00915 [Cupriavidus sp. USMAA2-4]
MKALNFGQAIEALKAGLRVARAGWNGKDMWLALSCNGTREVPAAAFWAPPNRAYAEANGGKATVLPSITMKTATGEILMGWLASQTDMLAEDWSILDAGAAAALAGSAEVGKAVPEPAPAAVAAEWKPTAGRMVTVKGYIANGTDEHPGIITRVHGAGEGALVNVTAFPDLQSPKIFSSIPVYTSRTAARDAIVGPSRAAGYAFFPDRV